MLLAAACDCGGGLGDGDLPDTPVLEVQPPIADFGRVTLGRSARVVLTISNTGVDVLRIRRARVNEALAPEVRVDAVPAALLSQRAAMIEVILDPTNIGSRDGELIFELETGEVRIPIVATVVDPALVVRPDEVDFGQVVLGDIESATVTVTNEGTGAVKISALTLDENTPSEFVVRLDASRSLDSGESFDFVIRYVPGERGIDEGRVVIADDADRPERVSVRVRGEGIASELAIAPDRLFFFGALVGEPTYADLELRNIGARTHEVTDIFVDGDVGADDFFWDEVAFPLPISIGPGEIVRIQIGFLPRQPGLIAAQLVLDSTALIQPARIVLEGSAAAAPTPLVDVRPNPIDLGTVAVGHPTPRRVVVANEGALSFTVEGLPTIEPPTAPFVISEWPRLDAVLSGQERVRFTVTAVPTTAGRHEAELVLRTTVADRTEVRVPISADARAEATPALLLEDDELAFGRVERGYAIERRLDVRSVGDVPLSLDTVVVEPVGPFSVEPFPRTTLLPGERASLRVTFTDPLGFVGTSSATLRLTTDDPDGVATVPLSATTVAPQPEEPELAVRLTWTPTDADVDLHLVRRGGVPFDVPADCCFCNPTPRWSLAGASTEDPILFADSADGAAGETIVVTNAAESLYTVYVHAVDTDVTARLEIENRGRIVTFVERAVLAERLWTAGDLQALETPDRSFVFGVSEVPLVEERRDRCF